MPTESTFFLAGLLFLAAGLGYFFARFGDLDAEDQNDSESSRFVRGFRYLLNEEPDRAVEAFTGGSEVNEEALEIQLSLGGLFRRRGELERAIRIHQNLVDRPGLSGPQRDRALFALAEDFLGAGLFDRAEELLNRLRQSPVYRAEALSRLLRICEVTRDWERAIELCDELRRADAGAVAGVQLANYYCESVVTAMAAGRIGEARERLAMALAADAGSIRARLLAADLALAGGNRDQALEACRRLAMEEPDLIPELLPRLAQCVSGEALDLEISALARASGEARSALAMAVVRNPQLQEPGALAVFSQWLAEEPLLAALVGGAPDGGPRDAAPAARLAEIRGALHRLARGLPPFQCQSCGYHSASLQWQCPGCRSWETIRFSTRLLPGSGSS